MAYDILSLVKPDKYYQSREEKHPEEDRRICFEVDPGVVYPATLQRIREVAMETKPQAIELFDNLESADIVKEMTKEAKKVKEEEFALASCPRDSCPTELSERRAEILELARKWFSRALRVSVGKPVAIHITRDSDWRL